MLDLHYLIEIHGYMYQLIGNLRRTIGNLNMKLNLYLYVKRVQNIFDCYRVAHVNRIFPKHTIPYIINMIDEPKI